MASVFSTGKIKISLEQLLIVQCASTIAKIFCAHKVLQDTNLLLVFTVLKQCPKEVINF